MCLVILGAPGCITIDLLCEQIWLDVVDGSVKATEVYDLFFTANSPGCCRLLALSPHVLADSSGGLQVRVDRDYPDNRKYDYYYTALSLGGAYYDSETAEFSAPLESWDGTPGPAKYRGRVIVPSAKVPLNLNNGEVGRFTRQFGTPFELTWDGNLEVGRRYAMRLEVRPRELRIDSPRISMPDPEGDEGTDTEGPWWEQGIQLHSPYMLFSTTQKLVTVAKDTDDVMDPDHSGAAEWSKLLVESGITCCEVARHRIALILPRHAELARDHCSKNAGPLPPTTIAIDTGSGTSLRAVHQWEYLPSQSKADHPRPVSEAILEWLRDWGGRAAEGGKRKEHIASVLGFHHSNCALIVDALVDAGVVTEVEKGSGRYVACPNMTEAMAKEAVGRVAASRAVRTHFQPKGFEITYVLRFLYHTAASRRRRELRTRQTKEAELRAQELRQLLDRAEAMLNSMQGMIEALEHLLNRAGQIADSPKQAQPPGKLQ